MPRSGPTRAPAPRAFVLVHGAWHGAWCWERVAALLSARGARVLAPEFGDAGREHTEVSLHTHVDIVTDAIDAAGMDAFVLVGHSYGGIVASAVADRMHRRIAQCVYLDAAVPADMSPGASIAWCDFYPDSERTRRIDAALSNGLIAAPAAAAFGVSDPADVDWLEARLRPMPIGAFTGRFTFRNGGSNGLKRRYVAFTSPSYAPLAATQERIRRDPSWAFGTLAVGHDAMITAPLQVAHLLDSPQA
jgi:pimeloyl-ACP methyl ester carboxylesterase